MNRYYDNIQTIYKLRDQIKTELDKIDILKITPIDAINILYKLKEMEK